MSRFLLSSAAEADIEAIADFLEDQAPHARDRVLRALWNSFRRTAATPGLGRLRQDLPDESPRFLVVCWYLVACRPGKPVEIARILHGSRNVLREVRRGRGR